MSYPTSIDALRALIQDSSGTQTETYQIASPYTYQLGKNASPAFPSAVQLVPHAGPALPAPSAPTLGAHLTSSGHFLTTGQVYKYALFARTRWGMTAIGSQLTVTPTGTGVTLSVSAAPVSTQNPATTLVLCRTKAAGSTFYVVRDLGTTSAVTVADGTPDDDLTVLAPTSDTSGFAAVTVTAPGPITYTEKPQGTTLTGHDYSVDYDYSSPTAGTVTFASADVGVTATLAYTAAALETAALLNLLVTAIKDLRGAAAAASGLATLDSHSRVVQAPASGVRQRVVATLTVDDGMSGVGSWTNLAVAVSLILPDAATLLVRGMLSASATVAAGPSLGLGFEVTQYAPGGGGSPIATTTITPGAGITLARDNAVVCLAGEATFNAPSAGIYVINLAYYQSSDAFRCQAVSNRFYEGATLVAEEYA